MKRWEILQLFIDKLGAKKYLEIGVQWGECFSQISCDYKVGVDPDIGSAATHKMTSDQFFAHNQEQFHICFIDGWHGSDQVAKDILNAYKVCPGGIVMVHDLLPPTEEHQNPYLNGDGWKAWAALKEISKDVMFIIDTDQGCGLIFPRHEPVGSNLDMSKFDWAWYEANRKNTPVMTVITVDEFKECVNKI